MVAENGEWCWNLLEPLLSFNILLRIVAVKPQLGELSSTVNFDAWGCGWPLAFGAVVWSLWLNKNALVFDPDSTSTVSVLDHSRRVVDSYNLAIATSSGPRHGSIVRPRQGARWIPSEAGFYKLNTDGLRCSNTGYASCGGIIRNDKGSQHAWDLGFRHVLVEVDSLMVVKMMSDNHVAFGGYSLVRHIVRLLNRDWYVSLSHIAREDMQASGAVVARASHEVLQEMPTSGVG
ncbi:hypothetical protein V6N12_059177 [Hibiscus sabdariffa]|uniref:RNase H type-1 domain-containing protein n=1 Tax=Hibiscus sabdariffa TaxID=183260 RepID=A0ABR2EUA2_9ROSI